VTLREWLRQRAPTAPPDLLARVHETLGSRCDIDAAQASAVCVEAADELLRELLTRPSTGRETALDLLTVDALATYAFEAASDNPESLSERAEVAMARFAAAARP
jgi:hypothetical protein